MKDYLGMLDHRCQVVLEEINGAFDHLGDLMTAAFDVECNTKLMESSVALALALGVPPAVLITSHEELDAFMMG